MASEGRSKGINSSGRYEEQDENNDSNLQDDDIGDNEILVIEDDLIDAKNNKELFFENRQNDTEKNDNKPFEIVKNKLIGTAIN